MFIQLGIDGIANLDVHLLPAGCLCDTAAIGCSEWTKWRIGDEGGDPVVEGWEDVIAAISVNGAAGSPPFCIKVGVDDGSVEGPHTEVIGCPNDRHTAGRKSLACTIRGAIAVITSVKIRNCGIGKEVRNQRIWEAYISGLTGFLMDDLAINASRDGVSTKANVYFVPAPCFDFAWLCAAWNAWRLECVACVRPASDVPSAWGCDISSGKVNQKAFIP